MLREPEAEKVASRLDSWDADRTELHAPLLTRYEIAHALAKRRRRGGLSPADTVEALRIIDGLDVVFDLAPDTARAVELAVELEHSAYDAAYLALAERLGAEVWTLDKPLARKAASSHRVNLIA